MLITSAAELCAMLKNRIISFLPYLVNPSAILFIDQTEASLICLLNPKSREIGPFLVYLYTIDASSLAHFQHSKSSKR